MANLTSDGDSLLRVAVRKGDDSLCGKLIAQKADCKGDIDAAGWTLLHVASNSGRLDIVNLLLNHGARGVVNQVTGWGDTACHLAARCGYGPVVIQLIREGADVTIKNYKGMTAMQEAERNQHWELLRQVQLV